MGLLRLAAIVVLVGRVAGDPPALAASGCPCVSSCERTLDLPDIAWCTTSPPDTDLTPNASLLYCGYYSEKKHAYWDACYVNTTGTVPDPTLNTLSGMWATMTVATTAACATAYGVAGCIASVLISRRRTLLWLPATSFVLGGCYGFGVGAMFAVIASFLFLSIPYAVDFSTIVALGIGLAVLIVYSGLGRQYERFTAYHASEYND